ncbi:unnamed protein product [Staurois parvus]|uniref:Uncharacterized protein n=1 Tax=Staurois parvus TaxID=386267 RepID=A0ABN9CHY0_9NEOB|nr:unnamed protein product [Staurois parvus]
MEPTSSVRRPESGTWQSVARWRQQQWEAVQGPMTHSGPGSSMRRRLQGPMTDYGPGSSMRSRTGAQHPITKWKPTNSVRRPESGTWQSLAMKSAAMGGRTGTHDTHSGPGSSKRRRYMGPWQSGEA